MNVSETQIKEWTQQARKINASHIICMRKYCTGDDYPVYIFSHENLDHCIKLHNAGDLEYVNYVIDVEKENNSLEEHVSDTSTLIGALRILANDIQSDDGVANTAIAEAADRLEELDNRLKEINRVCKQKL